MTPRIFVGAEAAAIVPGGDHALPTPAARHVAHALRMRVGQPLAIFTGAGGEYATTILRIDRREVVLRVDRYDAIERESPWPVTLVQSAIAADMMDWVVRKATELGAAAIVPVQSARSQGVPADRASRRVEHWRQIAIAACEQCGRNQLPSIARPVPFVAWIEGAAAAEGIAILDASGESSLAAQAAASPLRIVAIGPEGGFSPGELDLAERVGAVRVHFGPRVLRAETAAIAALATVNAISGDAAGPIVSQV